MRVSYQYLRTESEDEHRERVGEPEYVVELNREEERVLVSLVSEENREAVRGSLAGRQLKLICSCGFYTCPMVTRYGLPEPVYQAEIRPLPDKYQRDRRALELQGSNSN
jgi:hypothetical protein